MHYVLALKFHVFFFSYILCVLWASLSLSPLFQHISVSLDKNEKQPYYLRDRNESFMHITLNKTSTMVKVIVRLFRRRRRCCCCCCCCFFHLFVFTLFFSCSFRLNNFYFGFFFSFSLLMTLILMSIDGHERWWWWWWFDDEFWYGLIIMSDDFNGLIKYLS